MIDPTRLKANVLRRIAADASWNAVALPTWRPHASTSMTPRASA